MKLVAVLSALLSYISLEIVATDTNCADFKTCSFNGDRNAPLCFCDEDCIYYNDCCVDNGKVFRITGQLKRDRERQRQMIASLCQFIPEDSIFGVKVISSCQTDDTLTCYKEDGNLDLMDIVYVTGIDGLTYKNRHCALCNGITRFQFWSLQFYLSRSISRSGEYSCNGSFFENALEMNHFEIAKHLVKICKYRLIHPSDAQPRLCVSENYTCKGLHWTDENPFQIAKSSDSLNMMALFTFDERPEDVMDEVSVEGTISADVSLSNRVLNHRLWLESDSHLTLKQLYNLVDSVYKFLNTAVSDVVFTEPFFIDYIVVKDKEFRIQILTLCQSIDFVSLSRYTILKEWLKNLIIRYQDSNPSMNISYKVVSTSPWPRFEFGNESYNDARIRYYEDRYIVDSGEKLFGKKYLSYEGTHQGNLNISFPPSMCKEINISFTSFQNNTSFEYDCVFGEKNKRSHASHLYLSGMGIYLTIVLLDRLLGYDHRLTFLHIM